MTAALKYAENTNKSFNVKVEFDARTARKKIRQAEAAARRHIEAEIKTFGDIDEIIAAVEPRLQSDYPGAKLSIQVKPHQVHDAGRTTFFYKLRSNAGILMNLMVSPVGEKHVTSSGSKTTDNGKSDANSTTTTASTSTSNVNHQKTGNYKKQHDSTETRDVEYNKTVVRTLNDFINSASKVRNSLVSQLAANVVGHRTANWGEDSERHRIQKSFTDYTKNSKRTQEQGEKDKKNWAKKLQDGVSIVDKITTIPYVDKIPGVGWFTRKVKGWQFDLAKAGLGLFAESGTVKFTTTKLDEKAKTNTQSTDDANSKRRGNLTADSRTDIESKLTKSFKSNTDSEWKRYLSDIKATASRYHSKTDKHATTTVDNSQGETHNQVDTKQNTETKTSHREHKNQTTTATFTVSSTWKYTKPVVKASVTSGDAEVSNSPFPPEAGESSTK